jgi:hypothetical protein
MILSTFNYLMRVFLVLQELQNKIKLKTILFLGLTSWERRNSIFLLKKSDRLIRELKNLVTCPHFLLGYFYRLLGKKHLIQF